MARIMAPGAKEMRVVPHVIIPKDPFAKVLLLTPITLGTAGLEEALVPRRKMSPPMAPLNGTLDSHLVLWPLHATRL